MSLRRYQYFVDVVDTKSFTKAGERNFISQTAVSMQIAGLEKTLGVKLLERGSREVAPTEFGNYVYAKAKEMLAVEAQILRSAANHQECKQIQIVVDKNIERGLFYLFQQILNQDYDESKFWFGRMEGTEAYKKYTEKEYDAFVGYGSEQNKPEDETEALVLIENPLGVLVSEYGKLSDLDSIRLEDLKGIKGYACAGYPPSMIPIRSKRIGTLARQIEVVPNMETLVMKVEMNDGFAFVDSRMIDRQVGFVKSLDEPDANCRLMLYYRDEQGYDATLIRQIGEKVKKRLA